jgi:signal transduction histidine kinase
MFARPLKIVRRSAARRVVTVFTVAILLPTLLVLAAGFWTYHQDRSATALEVSERTERAADEASAALQHALDSWESALARVALGPVPAPAHLPAPLAAAVAEPASAVLFLVDGESVRVLPDRCLACDVVSSTPEPVDEAPPFTLLADAETAELAQKDYLRAAAIYERPAELAGLTSRALITHRLARVYRRQGRNREAIAAYRRLAGETTALVDGVPADLVGRYQLCVLQQEQQSGDEAAASASALYRDLVDVRWQLDCPSYLYYADSTRRWAEETIPPAPELDDLKAFETRRLALTEAAREALATPPSARVTVGLRALRDSSGQYIILWFVPARTASGARAAGLVVADALFARLTWPAALAGALGGHFGVALRAADGQPLLVSGHAPDGEQRIPVANRRLGYFDSWMQLRLWPAAPESFGGAYRVRQRLYLAALGLVLVSLVFTGVVTARTLRRELEVASLKSEFASTVSHEFRTPLTGIRQLADLLRQGRVPSEERRQEYYDLILRESARLNRLVENVLDFSRMEDGRKHYRFEPVDTSAWLARVVSEFQHEIAGTGVSVITAIPADLPVLLADDQALASVVHNLLDNAVKYSPERSAVWLEAEAGESRVTIRVRDEGLGIAPSDAPHVFERYYRGQRDATHQVAGTGLGLSLVKHIVTAHDGTVEFTSRLGEGTTFLLHLPSAPAAPGTPAGQRGVDVPWRRS